MSHVAVYEATACKEVEHVHSHTVATCWQRLATEDSLLQVVQIVSLSMQYPTTASHWTFALQPTCMARHMHYVVFPGIVC